MRLQVIRAEALSSTDLNGKSDPFVRVFYDGKELAASPSVKRSLNPRWDFDVAVTLVHAGPLDVEIEVADKDEFTPSDLLGALRVPFPPWRELVATYQHRKREALVACPLDGKDTVAGKGTMTAGELASGKMTHTASDSDVPKMDTAARGVTDFWHGRSRSFNSSGSYYCHDETQESCTSAAAGGELGGEKDEMDIDRVFIWCRLVKGLAAQGRILCSVQYEERDLKYLVNHPYGTSIQEVFLPQNPRFEHAYCHLPRSWHPDVAVRQDELTAMHAGTPKDCLFPWHEKLLHMVEEVTVTFHVNESNQGVLATLVLTNYRIWFVPYRRVRGLLHEDVHTLPVSKILKATIQQQKRSNNNVITVLILDNMDAGHYHVTLSPISRLRNSVRDFSREAELKRVKTLHNIVREIDWLRIENSFCSPTDRNHVVATADEMQLEDDLLHYTPKHSSSSMPPPMTRALTANFNKYQKRTFTKEAMSSSALTGSCTSMERPKFKHHQSESAVVPQLTHATSMRKPPQHFQLAARRRIRYDPEAEFARQGALNHPRWRKCTLNENYQLCSTYPSFLMVPESLNDEIIKEAAGFRSKSRFPALSWIHPRTGAPLCRSSQPNTGVLRSTNPEDKKLIWAIRDAAIPVDQAAKSRHTLPKKKNSVLHIVDARPEINAKSNALAGKGHESVKQYDRDGIPMAAITFMGIDNIHVVRNSLAGLAQALYEVEDSNFFGAVQKSRWLEHICSILQGATEVATHLERGEAVLVHCSDGWDRTAQLSSLAQIMLDPYYRTLEGFAQLCEKDWCSFGHNFQRRCSHPTSDQTSPIFLQFIDAVYQLTLQFPTHFQFNELLLSSVAEAVYSSWYGTFQKNSECERRLFLSSVASVSVWDVIRATTDQFLNPLFAGRGVHASKGSGSYMEPMLPVCRVRVMQLWVSQYQKAIGHMRLQQREFEMLQLIRQQEADLSRLYAALTNDQHLELRAGQIRSDIAKLSRSMNLKYPDAPVTPLKEPGRKGLMSSFGGDTHRSFGELPISGSLDFHDLASIVAMGTAGASARAATSASSPAGEHTTMMQMLHCGNLDASPGPLSSNVAGAPLQSTNLPTTRRRRSLTSRSRSNSLKSTLINVVAQMKGGSQDKEVDETEDVGSATVPNPIRVSEGRRNQCSNSPSRREELKRDLRHLESQLSKLDHQVAIKENAAKQTLRRFRCYNYNLPETALRTEKDTFSPSSGTKVRLGGSNGVSKSYHSPRTSSPPSSSSSPRSVSTSVSAGVSGDLGDSSSVDLDHRDFAPGSSPLLGTDKVISGGNFLNSQPVWERDEDATCCKRCKKKFKTILRNRHHCRCCGYVFCGRCTSHRMSLPDFGYYDVVRVCKVCYNSGEDG
uniref:phosphatidylinositol-3,5-bisphosphate 3-phosphatase n=1 Tax=Peronospora matthiolae TaxID=2874970 RepID=A0AAV1TQ82_9STRA